MLPPSRLQRLDRRRFLQSTAAAASAVAVFGSGPRLRAAGPNEKLNIACIGTANRANANIGGVQGENIVALADVDANYLGAAQKRFPQAKAYADFRELLDKEHKNIDAVVVSTADHTHAPATGAGMRLGKHAYCEKPLTHTVAEARTLAKLAKENKLATQMGTQIHAGDNYRRAVELVQSGAIGDVTEAHVWCGKGWSNGRFGEPQPAPAHLNWDLWLGPAEKREYSAGIHPANWRRFWDYGSGTLGDMACHIMDVVFWGLELRHPTTVAAEGPELHPDGCPAWLIVHMDYPARGNRKPVTTHWYDGGKKPPIMDKIIADGGPDLRGWGIGAIFEGTKGMLAVDYGRRVLLPADKFKDFTPPEPTIPNSTGHYNEWITACKTGSPTTCNFDYSGALTESVLLGAVAFRTGKKLEWDAKNLKATNVPEADEFISKQYRKGWEV